MSNESKDDTKSVGKSTNVQHVYLTPLGRRGVGAALNKPCVDVVRYQHDILSKATEEFLDVVLFSGNLEESYTDEFFKETTESSEQPQGKTMADMFKAILDQGRDVKILLESPAGPDALSPNILNLSREYGTAQSPKGQMSLFVVDAKKKLPRLPHFLLAYRESSSDEDWFIRLEDVHEPRKVGLSSSEWSEIQSKAVIYFKDSQKNARDTGRLALSASQRIEDVSVQIS